MARNSRPKRAARKSMLIVCEGENTEPLYLSALKEALVLGASVDIQVQGGVGHTDPLGLIKEAEGFVKQRKRESRESPTKSEYEVVWVVFDAERKANAELRGAITQARQMGYHVGLSRPAFEAWYLLHTRRNLPHLPGGRDAEVALRQNIPGYDKSRASAKAAAQWSISEQRPAVALRHAESTANEVFPEPGWSELPMMAGTGVYRLVKELIAESTDLPAKQRLGLV